MTRTRRGRSWGWLFFTLLLLSFNSSSATAEVLELKRGDHVCYIGNTMADRMQHHAWLETYLHALHPEHEMTFRNLGFAGDEVKTRPRSDNFGSPDQWLTKCEADVIFCFFGYNEALRGEKGLPQFSKEFAEMLDGMLAQQYNGVSSPRIVVFSPIAHENLHSPHLPDGTANNKNLELYTREMRDICAKKQVPFVDLFTPTRELYKVAEHPLTLNGIHLTSHGNRVVADVAIDALYGKNVKPTQSQEELERLRQAVLEKNLYWFSRYRVVDGYNVYGGRSKLEWFGQSNADVMRREMEIFDVMTANRDARVWAVARGSDLKIVDNNIPEQLTVQTNKPGELEGGRHPYVGGEEAIEKMTVAEGMKVNLFASEKEFPELANPVQMAVDTDSRLFVTVWPSYPHWNPTEPRTDRILCFPDEDLDGKADRCIVFADKLNSVTGFEFWGGGVLVAAPPEIWFLKDTDGDDIADVKIRMLQGVSSADTHHSANAMLVGPDGKLVWSRGIFNVTNMETPTQTYRSIQSGVHWFDPRTFEVGFRFPIGPNPHGDVFDQWGYQFANDGTSGTGSYVNIGKGVGNKHWFKKRVRPVAATGILSSSHFPEHNNGNFLICNTIGFLGVLQHKVQYNGADITAVEIEPILVSSDPNFRPTDLEIGGDGALYVSDWCNVLIGHMQHNMRDPNRDHTHGRIYRVSYPSRPLLKPAKMKGKPIAEVCEHFFAKENSVRYRARLELSGRDTADIVKEVGEFASHLNPQNVSKDRDEAQALLECLWTFAEHRVPNQELLIRLFHGAEEPRVRAAAIRTLGQWGDKVADWQTTLMAAAQDKSALVRAEAVKSAVSFDGLEAAEVIFQVAAQPTDPELDVVLKYAQGQLNVDAIVRDAIRSKTPLSPAAQKFVYNNASVEDLLQLPPSAELHRVILTRENATSEQRRHALAELSKSEQKSPATLLMDIVEQADAEKQTELLAGIGRLLVEEPAEELSEVAGRIEKLAAEGKTATGRRLAYAAWVTADGSGDDAFLASTRGKSKLRDFLESIPSIADADARAKLYEKVHPLMTQLPANLSAEGVSSSLAKPGLKVEYFHPSPKNVARETLEKMSPKANGVVSKISLNTPVIKKRDQFALRFTGAIEIPQAGKYTFFTKSDDGSRLYIGEREVVNNDGLHGMQEKNGSIELPAGSHPITVTYFDNGGGDGLEVSWQGPGINKQQIPADRLTVTVGESLHDVAIRALASIPGHDRQKFTDLAALVKAGQSRAAAINVLRKIPQDQWPQKEIGALIDNLIGYLSQIPVNYRTGAAAQDATELAKSLAAKLPPEAQNAILERLKNLDVRVIAIGTVPHRMIFDKEEIAVAAGRPVEFRFSNTDEMPHNFSIVQPGALEEIGLMAEATARDPDAMERQYIPESDKIMLASRLLQPGEHQSLTFEAPDTPGVYPYVCTYPGHWRRMFGALYVVENLDEYLADPAAYLAAHPLPIKDELLKLATRDREWKFDELIGAVKPLPPGRSFEVGKQLFKVSNCVSCHKLDGEGQVFGPDLAKLDKKKKTVEHILRSMLEPSHDIDKDFRSHIFELASGKVVTGMVVKETADSVEVVIDPLAKGKATVIKKSDIDDRVVSDTSIMPLGLLNRLSREEILDLVAFVLSGGDKKHKMYESHDHHH